MTTGNNAKSNMYGISFNYLMGNVQSELFDNVSLSLNADANVHNYFSRFNNASLLLRNVLYDMINAGPR